MGLNLKNPAAVGAFLRGDLENAIIASTPGGILAQEAAGQAELIAHGGKLPKSFGRYNPPTREQVTAATGIEFGQDIDDIFVAVTLPPGWKIQATEHSMNSDLLDENGCKRANVFYKAAFYDRNADISFNRRYEYGSDYAIPIGTVTVRDTKTGKVLHTVGECHDDDYKQRDSLTDKAKEWLDVNFPKWNDPFAYWKE